MRVLSSTYGGRGDVEPVVGLAVALRELGAQVRVCAVVLRGWAGRVAVLGIGAAAKLLLDPVSRETPSVPA